MMKSCKFNEKNKREEISSENQYPGSLTLSTLNTYVSYPDDNQFIKGVLWGTKWRNLPNNEFTYTINWGNSTKKSITENNVILEFQEPTTSTRNSVIQCMNDLAEFINLKVRYVNEVNDAILSFNFIPSNKIDYLGYAIPPNPSFTDNRIDQYDDTPGNIFIGYNTSMNFQKGSYNYITIVHELGHAIGLAHPHDTGGSSSIFDGVTSPFGDFGDYNANLQPLTIMTYNDIRSPYVPNTTSTTGFLATFGPIDIVALQFLYGKNETFNSGNNTYTFPNSLTQKFWETIWDTGGINTIDASTSNVNTVINLNDATIEDNKQLAGTPLSYNIFGGITIAKGTKIQNIITGTKNDIITGNEYNNQFTVTDGGIDTINGGSGYDTVIINNTSSNFIIEVNGSSILLKKGDEVNQVTLFNCEKIIFNDKEIIISDLLNPTTEPPEDPPVSDNTFSSIMESGKVSLTSTWKTITYKKIFQNPVLIFSDPTLNNGDPCTTQIRNITSTSCQVRLDEPNYRDNKHPTEEVSYIIGEKGSWNINGIRVQFGTSTVGKGFKTISLPTSYSSKPTVLTQIQSTQNSDWVITRTRNIRNSNFQVRIQKEEKREGTSFQNEIVGWMSINNGNYTRGQKVQTNLVSRVNHNTKTIRYSSSFSSTPILLTKVASYMSNEPCNTRIVRNRSTYFQVKVLEDKSKDTEIRHRNEYIYYFAISENQIVEPPVDPPVSTNIFSSIMESGKVSLTSTWKTITYKKTFQNPVLIFSDPTLNNGDPCTTQIRNITSTSCQVRLDEPNYRDNKHPTEEVSYIIGEKGSWNINGIRVQFGTSTVGKGFKTISLPTSYSSKPTVLTQIQSTQNSDWVITRTRNIRNSNFQVRIQKEEKREGTSFQNEIVGWMSINNGNYTRGQKVQTNLVSRVNHNTKTIRYSSSFSSTPILLTKVASYMSNEPCNTRIVRNRSTYFQVKVLEDKSKDTEIRHRNEYIYYFAIL